MKVPLIKSLSENKEFFYAVALILLIPAAILANTYLFIQGLNKTFDIELTNKANLATRVLSSTIKNSVEDKNVLEDAVDLVVTNSPEVLGLTILSFEQGIPITLATSEGEEAVSTETVLLTKLAWTTQQPYTTRIETLNDKGQAITLWQVSLPIVEENPISNTKENSVKGESDYTATTAANNIGPTGFVKAETDSKKSTKEADKSKDEAKKQTLAVINLKVSGEKSDVLINQLEKNSIVVALATLAVVVLLLLNHFRFFGYARLFTKLKEVDEMKDNFISLASHELRTPVTALRGFASLAVRHFQTGDQQTAARDMDMVSKSAEGIEELVNDLLDVSRIEQKRLKLEINQFELTTLITEVVQQLQSQATQKGLALTYEAQNLRPFIAADPGKVKQVFVNLIGNAIKYTPKGSVEVSHELEGNTVKTLIKDTGVGIPAQELPTLFEKFHRVQNEKTRQIRGTGLGLWITKQLVEMMKGKIFIESIENTGTKVIVVFPLIQQNPG